MAILTIPVLAHFALSERISQNLGDLHALNALQDATLIRRVHFRAAHAQLALSPLEQRTPSANLADPVLIRMIQARRRARSVKLVLLMRRMVKPAACHAILDIIPHNQVL